MSKIQFILTSVSMLAAIGLAALMGPQDKAKTESAQAKQEDQAVVDQATDKPLERARREVKLLDDIYKTSIVLITEHYVKDKDDLPAGEAFILLFETMQKKGWHEVRLIDATGDPINDDNSAKNGFETKAIKELVAGKAIYDEVIEEDGKRFLRSATAVPVVMDKCITCHDNYADLPKGRAIGAVGYKVPIFDDE